MTEYLYRFRPVDRLLGKNHELERQEIYFASPDQLNDPMEGFKDIFWKGDAIAWQNLFKHFLLCLNHAYATLAILQEEYPITWQHIPVLDPHKAAATADAVALQQSLFDQFFSNPTVSGYIDRLSRRHVPIRRIELETHIKSIHLIALPIIFNTYQRRGLIPRQKIEMNFVDKTSAEMLRLLDGISTVDEAEAGTSGGSFDAEIIFAAQRSTARQLDLINQYNRTIDPERKNRLFVLVNFPGEYVQQIEQIVHPDWYAACFMIHCSNSSTWGHYGSSHSGVCLKFKTTQTDAGPTLRLRTLNGIGSGGPLYGLTNHLFRPITYDSRYLAIDFFRTLGRLPIPIANAQWYSDGKGGRSSCAEGFVGQSDERRNEYWKDFYAAATTKLKDWEYEAEYRIVLYSSLFELSPTDRAVQYEFSDLDGIIFGIKTSIDDKLKITKIIANKCRIHNRKDFNFYQAYYSSRTAKIEYSKMPLLKFDINGAG
ncbi:DUF2971 domain-containing protein [Caballeronia cordobensis]|uniref:DUF2971 domain-containing protein n=1 Tax=Caballeronia cordobensis TaxID=1353886 RepID=UPI00045F0A0B|nr:putative membrane protein [Burkholderia sp. RPE67]